MRRLCLAQVTLKEFEDAFGKGSLNERNLWERLRSGNLGLTLADFQMVAGRFVAQHGLDPKKFSPPHYVEAVAGKNLEESTPT